MTFYYALASYLKDANFGNDARIYPVQAPQNAAAPYCVFSIVDDQPQTIHNGGYSSGLSIVQIDIFSDQLSEVDQLTESVKNTFVGKSFVLLESAGERVEVAHGDTQNESDAFDDDQGLWARSFDLRIRYIKK